MPEEISNARERFLVDKLSGLLEGWTVSDVRQLGETRALTVFSKIADVLQKLLDGDAPIPSHPWLQNQRLPVLSRTKGNTLSGILTTVTCVHAVNSVSRSLRCPRSKVIAECTISSMESLKKLSGAVETRSASAVVRGIVEETARELIQIYEKQPARITESLAKITNCVVAGSSQTVKHHSPDWKGYYEMPPLTNVRFSDQSFHASKALDKKIAQVLPPEDLILEVGGLVHRVTFLIVQKAASLKRDYADFDPFAVGFYLWISS